MDEILHLAVREILLRQRMTQLPRRRTAGDVAHQAGRVVKDEAKMIMQKRSLIRNALDGGEAK